MLFSQASYEFGFANTTWLRRNPLYYQFYCVGLNTVFAHVFPLLSLLYLNIYTVIGEARKPISRPLDKIPLSSDVYFGQKQEKPEFCDLNGMFNTENGPKTLPIRLRDPSGFTLGIVTCEKIIKNLTDEHAKGFVKALVARVKPLMRVDEPVSVLSGKSANLNLGHGIS